MALSGLLAEAGTIPSRSLVEDLFLELPTDARFHQVTNQKVVPATALDDNSTQITFQLPALDLPNVYFLQDTLIECVVVITKADGRTLPAKADKVCFVNNAIGSLFSNVALYINDALISTTGSNYAYKDYLQTLLSYSSDSKSGLQGKGWFVDSPPQSTGIENNSAYGERTAMFRRDRSSTGDFKPEGCTLIDKLCKYLTIWNCQVNIIIFY